MTTAKQSQATAEQFLASQGIKFRVVAAKRGPGEWNVTFSRHGGGRLKLDFYQSQAPTPGWAIEQMILIHPDRPGYDSEYYLDDLAEYINVVKFFTPAEIKQLIRLRNGKA
jgi:hypothetical protein